MDGCQFFVVGNVPSSFHSANLRNHFSHFVESEHFRCFHYRHRPEECRPNQLKSQHPIGPDGPVASTSLSSPFSGRTRNKTYCCVVAVEGSFGKSFVDKYHQKNWSYLDGGLLPGKVKVSRLNVTMTKAKEESKMKSTDTTTVDTTIAEGASTSPIPWADLATIIELNPPTVMPNGNVGTSLYTFTALIRACKLPAYLIKKLQLEFPKSRSSKKYGAVAFEYGSKDRTGGSKDRTGGSKDRTGGSKDRTGGIIRKGIGGIGGGSSISGGNGGTQDWEDTDLHNMDVCGDVGKDSGRCEGNSDDEDDDIPSDDDHDAEEWERYEAYQEDVDKQGRCKERLFEEEMEVVWEKGGSGLVFYTDASHWDQQDGDFDEKCSQEDHWDVDMSVYYDPGGGSRDGRDMRAMERERRLREGEDISSWKIGGFEKHTKGIGSKVLGRSGWVAGQGVGASNQGITEPLESDGQLPSVKRGLGYRGEKLERQARTSTKKRKLMKDVIISTIYDTPEEVQSTILRSAPPSVLKHRTVTFQRGGTLRNEENAFEIPSKTQHLDHKRIM